MFFNLLLFFNFNVTARLLSEMMKWPRISIGALHILIFYSTERHHSGLKKKLAASYAPIWYASSLAGNDFLSIKELFVVAVGQFFLACSKDVYYREKY